jgi:hypothetical protein
MNKYIKAIKRFCLPFVMFFVFTMPSMSQGKLKPEFDREEYMQLIKIAWQHFDTASNIPEPPMGYHRVFRSPDVGLMNRWDFWLRDDSVGVISIRASVSNPESWLENFYSPMIPAIGSIYLNDSTTFNYKFALDPRAAVHLGWTLGIGYLSPSIVQKINEYYRKGVKEYIIMGHSQGGTLAFLLRSYLEYLDSSVIPKDIRFKTYCSAPPKPGNLFYAYDFDYINRGDWGLRVVNMIDWVPEIPFSIQTISDLNSPNPFLNPEEGLGNQKFYVRWYIHHALHRLNKGSQKAKSNYVKYFGKNLYKQIHKTLKEYKQPKYAESYNYMPAGTPVILHPDDAYYEKFKGNNVFLNHGLEPYLFLTETYSVNKNQ